ncbi:peroxiredoxin-like family protein [Halioxenophilus sp. WMMB6]|uniref:peroxiredoxin-like family protein n=1 Tax=Halioxenophilus sp. WMMB6 TaxID=3073815 RepID=UPI00295EBB68|nr:peroxiredoxin-like family protein [Halioxenophilus sp. WMMB6]
MSSSSYLHELTQLEQQLEGMLPPDKLAIFRQDAAALAAAYRSPLKLTAGSQAADFALPHADGQVVKLSQLLAQGPAVVVFYRGVWCPYCNLALRTYQAVLPEIKAAGATLIAISPMTQDNSLETINANELDFYVLSDIGNQVARHYTTIIKNPMPSMQAMTELGYDFFSYYGDDSAELPIPAAFVIAPDGTIVFAEAEDGDYRKRTEASAILQALATINTTAGS